MHVVLTSQVGREEAVYICCDPQLGGFKCSLMFITVNIFDCPVHLPTWFFSHYFFYFRLCKDPCIYLPDLYPRYYEFVCIKTFVNKLVYGMRVHQNTWGKVSQAQKWVRKQDDEKPNLTILLNKQLFGMDAGRCTDKPWQFFCACAVVFLPKWVSRWLWHHNLTSQGSLMR